MKSFNEPQRAAVNAEPMFQMIKGNNYGRTVNLRNETVAAEYVRYKLRIGEHRQFAVSDLSFLYFEIDISRKHPAELAEFVNSFGGLEAAKQVYDAASKTSWLISYWIERTEEYESIVSEPDGLETCEAYSA